ncbi:hypothetical protein F5Y17DRAFT_245953 [Xylariaceae sp. FL0594]|nr:hypothetical protein F5Y17DRAFT_245953 [Xylariaceae sp. FL0594]
MLKIEALMPFTIRPTSEWYDCLCVITGTRDASLSCHILPNAIERNNWQKDDSWGYLECFWPHDDAQAPRDLLQDPRHEQTNLLILQSNAHKCWYKHWFWFRPKEQVPCNPIEMVFVLKK